MHQIRLHQCYGCQPVSWLLSLTHRAFAAPCLVQTSGWMKTRHPQRCPIESCPAPYNVQHPTQLFIFLYFFLLPYWKPIRHAGYMGAPPDNWTENKRLGSWGRPGLGGRRKTSNCLVNCWPVFKLVTYEKTKKDAFLLYFKNTFRTKMRKTCSFCHSCCRKLLAI